MKESNEVRIGRYLSGEAGREEKEAFERELESNPELRQEFLAFQRIWDHLPADSNERWDSGQAWQKFVSSTQIEIPQYPKTRNLKTTWLIAAVVIMALGAFFVYWKQGKSQIYVYENADPVSLPDGSKVYLNKGSSLEVYPFNRKKRRVALQGEAFFEITANAKRPFSVEAGKTITEVVGTSFNITQTPNNTRILVQEGKVIFKSTVNGESAVALNAGEAAMFEDDRIQLIPNPSANINAWHTRNLIFSRNMSIAEILADASVYFNKKISLENVSLGDCRISNQLSYKNPEINAVLRPLASFVNGTLKIEEDHCMIMGGRCP